MPIIMYAIPACTAIMAAWYAILVLVGMHREECDICPLHRASVSSIAWFIVFMTAAYIAAQALWFVRGFGDAIGWHDVLWTAIETSYLALSLGTRARCILFFAAT